MGLLIGKKILLGVSGGIAAYKTPGLVRQLRQMGASVRVVMTRAATEFIGPLSLQAVSGAPVGLDLFDPSYEDQIGHIELARWPDVVLLAPATAHLIGRMANGLADDLLTTLLLATTAPVVVAPAMNSKMFAHPLVQANMERLAETGYQLVEPDTGELACQEVGTGRLPDPPVLIDAIVCVLTPQKLANQRVLVTVGPTREWVDSVRYLSNPSSGRMGFAMCSAAHHLGARVTAVVGPATVSAPPQIEVVRVESAREMAEAVHEILSGQFQIAVFTAAVADIRPADRVEGKIPKQSLSLQLDLERNPDILAGVCSRDERPYCVGFAAETRDLEARTVAKCREKRCDLIVGNDVNPGGAFQSDLNRVILASAEGVIARIGPAEKSVVAREVWEHILARRHEGTMKPE